MHDADRGALEQISEEIKPEVLDDEHDEEDATSRSHDNTVVSFIDIIGRVSLTSESSRISPI